MAQSLYNEGRHSINDICQTLGVSRATLYRMTLATTPSVTPTRAESALYRALSLWSRNRSGLWLCGFGWNFDVSPVKVVLSDVRHFDLPLGRVTRSVGHATTLKTLHQHLF